MFTFFYWITGAFTLFLLSIITAPFLNKAQHRRLGSRCLGNAFGGFFKFLVFIRVVTIDDKELDAYCDMEGPLIIASNHPALWDAPLLIQRFIYVSCIMKKEVLDHIILRAGSRFAGFIPNRPILTMVREAIEHLNQGGRLLMFPEGTRTERSPLNPFRPGLALLAKNAGCPILPVFIFMNSRYMKKGWPIWTPPPIPITVSIKVGERLRIKPGEGTHDFSDRLHTHFKSTLEELDPWKETR